MLCKILCKHNVKQLLVACYALSVSRSVRPSVRLCPLYFCPNDQVTSKTAPAHPHATGVAMYPALLKEDLNYLNTSGVISFCVFSPVHQQSKLSFLIKYTMHQTTMNKKETWKIHNSAHSPWNEMNEYSPIKTIKWMNKKKWTEWKFTTKNEMNDQWPFSNHRAFIIIWTKFGWKRQQKGGNATTIRD